MAAPGFPLPLRNALASLALAALADDDARDALAWLATPDDAPAAAPAARLAAVHLIDAGGSALLAVHEPWALAVRAHAARALAAAAARRADGGSRPDAVAAAAADAVALWNAGLFFEVHEVLEAVWCKESGALRQALQGVIQIAVAYHHLSHDNPRGARTLMKEGRARLTGPPGGTVPGLDINTLLTDTAPWEHALLNGTRTPEHPPRLHAEPPGQS